MRLVIQLRVRRLTSTAKDSVRAVGHTVDCVKLASGGRHPLTGQALIMTFVALSQGFRSYGEAINGLKVKMC